MKQKTSSILPLEAEAKSWSSELRQRVRTSFRCPGSSTVYVLVASSGSLDFEGGGTV